MLVRPDRFRLSKPLLAVLLTSGLAACSTTTAAASKAADAEDKAPRQIAMGCVEAKAGWAIGKQVDDALAEKAKTDAEARFVRVIKPGHAYTMEYNGARLNLNTNKDGLILSVNCG